MNVDKKWFIQLDLEVNHHFEFIIKTKSKELKGNSEGGSILVTGYRGTCKSSLVNYVIHQLTTIAPKELDYQRKYDFWFKHPINVLLSPKKTWREIIKFFPQKYWLSLNVFYFCHLSTIYFYRGANSPWEYNFLPNTIKTEKIFSCGWFLSQ